MRTLPLIAMAAVLACSLSVRSWARTPVTCASPATSQPQPTEYFVSVADYATHLAHVSIRFPRRVEPFR